MQTREYIEGVIYCQCIDLGNYPHIRLLGNMTGTVYGEQVNAIALHDFKCD
jgi:hypothetical protein